MIYFDSAEMKRSRFLFMLQAAFEYLIALLMVEGTILAELANNLGFNSAQTGVLYSIISLGCLFQILSMLFRRGSVKKFSIIMSIINQVLFMVLYIIPDVPIDASIKRIVFVVFVILAYAGLYTANPKISYWRVSLVEVNKRGKYNGFMQMISLVLGMGFSYIMGAMVDHYKWVQQETGVNQMPTIFRICALTIFGLLIIHQLILFSIVELPREEEKKTNVLKNILNVATNKKILLIAGAFALWSAAQYSAMPFYKDFQIRAIADSGLGMSQTMSTMLNVIIGGIFQFAVAIPIGMVGDKFSFKTMLLVCLVTMFLRSFVVIFVTPENSTFCFVLYNLFHSFSAVGAYCALMNIVFTSVPENICADSYAFCQSVGGIVGFLTSLVMGGIISSIQDNGNTFLGIKVPYAEQVLSIIACLLAAIAVVYVMLALKKTEKTVE